MRSTAAIAAEFSAIGTTCRVLVTERSAAARAAELAAQQLADLDRAASRFRSDSELMRLRNDGMPQRVSPLLGNVVAAGIRAARLTDGLVDPTVGGALIGRGYDRDLDAVRALGDRTSTGSRPAPGWRSVRYDDRLHLLAIPPDCTLDFGASAKAFCADRLAARIHDTTGAGTLVDLGGDIATAGPTPVGGWRIGVETATGDVLQTVLARGQAFATSSTQLRTWRCDGVRQHHIIDPRTGAPAEVVWRQVTVAGGTALEANSASTAAILLGHDAPAWLGARRLPALLLGVDGAWRHTPGWPEREAA
ncbi:FAD:protein FMN transferase [Flexivirga oryzae]|uniref:FAD:protein FMN transferase n=1 Tax=Flexivirga oryzae TaxID=1794944 RepID=A0A839N6A9_9MICO|nr:thiamine biosynthesis lipoprotein [Flexivirga oryzae]